jgi:aspartate/methionine/tyrosine aminotransferase
VGGPPPRLHGVARPSAAASEIASLYDRIEPEGVLVFAGAEEAIFCLSNVLLGPGDHAIVTWPAYQSLYEVGRAAGASVTLHDLREMDGWALDVDRLLSALRPATRLVVVNAPHNPTGMLPERDEWDRLTGELADRGIHLLADEVYRYLEVDEADRLRAGADAFERGISLGVMSKSFALAGLRIGWLATRDRELLARCAAFKDYTTICSSAPSEILALIGLRARDRVLARSRAIVTSNLARLDAFFADHADRLAWVRPRGGSIGFPRLLGPESIDAFAARLVEREGVLLLPGSAFEHPGNHFRLGFGGRTCPRRWPASSDSWTRADGGVDLFHQPAARRLRGDDDRGREGRLGGPFRAVPAGPRGREGDPRRPDARDHEHRDLHLRSARRGGGPEIHGRGPGVQGGFATGELRPFRVSLLRGRD